MERAYNELDKTKGMVFEYKILSGINKGACGRCVITDVIIPGNYYSYSFDDIDKPVCYSNMCDVEFTNGVEDLWTYYRIMNKYKIESKII